jgi:ATP-dependent Clp protease ATP-binding subunit ClpB
VRRRPYTVVLLDEIEKSHREVCNVLLQVLDEGTLLSYLSIVFTLMPLGRLTDGSGKLVDFRNTVLIMTSNLGSQDLPDVASITDEQRSRLTIEAVKEHFPPCVKFDIFSNRIHHSPCREFVNRLDEIIVFSNLSPENMYPICDLQLAAITDTMSQDKRVNLLVSKEVRDYLSRTGFDPAYGARPLKRVIQRQLLGPLAKFLLEGNAQKNGQTPLISSDL